MININKKWLLLLVIAGMTIFAFGAYLYYRDWKTRIMMEYPKSPKNFFASPISATEVELSWEDASNNELGFNIYRDDKQIQELPENSEKYVDRGLRPGTTFSYKIRSFNQVGQSDFILGLGTTKNPPLIITITKIGVHENGEEGELFRDFELSGKPSEGEVQVGFVLSDNKTTTTVSLPSQDYYLFKKDEVKNVNIPIFFTDEVGESLKIFVTAYEKDGGGGEQLIYKVLGIIATSAFDSPTSLVISIAGIDFSKIFSDIFGAEDDWMGSYANEWENKDNWGVGNYEDIKCIKQDGDVGIRVWFTVDCPVYDYSAGKAR